MSLFFFFFSISLLSFFVFFLTFFSPTLRIDGMCFIVIFAATLPPDVTRMDLMSKGERSQSFWRYILLGYVIANLNRLCRDRIPLGI